MKLKWQITVIAVLSLSFPWVVWLAFKSLDQTFQTSIVEAAQKQAQVIVSSVQIFNQQHNDSLSGYIPTALASDAALDGADTEWAGSPWYQVTPRMRFKLGQINNHWQLLVAVKDGSSMTDPTGQRDQLIVALGDQRGMQKLTLNRQAEGPVIAPLAQAAYQAYWHETADGYQVEMRLSNPDLWRLGLVAIDHLGPNEDVSFGHIEDQQIQLQALFRPASNWLDFLTQITPEDTEINIKDPAGRVYYHSSNPGDNPSSIGWITELIYELAFDQNLATGSQFNGHQVTQKFPGGEIELLVNHNAAQLSLIQNFIRSVLSIFALAVVLLVGYFIYALILAWRIKRLHKGLQTVLDDRGHISTALPSGKASDEIGDLSRGMSAMLSQINDYTEYLKQLGSRLSHEMKTPISIVNTSLENLQMEQADNPFVERALKANHRLKFILNQLSALSQLKQVIAETDQTTFDLNGLLGDLATGYQSQAPHLTFKPAEQAVKIKGSPELMAQLLDKLVQNAIDFTTAQDDITLGLSCRNNRYQLQVSNSGSQLPTEHAAQLFDSLTSFREHRDDQPHLGLGLYIAQLIATFHQAELSAENTTANTVAFTITGPLCRNKD